MRECHSFTRSLCTIHSVVTAEFSGVSVVLNENPMLSFLASSWSYQSIGNQSIYTLNRWLTRHVKFYFRFGSVTLADELDTIPRAVLLRAKASSVIERRLESLWWIQPKNKSGKLNSLDFYRLPLCCEKLFSTWQLI